MLHRDLDSLWHSLLNLLRQGVTPEKLALSLSLGVAISCFPLFGATTTLCFVAALLLRLNIPAIQLANYAACPLQILLLWPFISMGERLFHSTRLGLGPTEFMREFRTAPYQMLRNLWAWEWHAMIVWLIFAVPVVLLLNLILRQILRRVSALKTATAAN